MQSVVTGPRSEKETPGGGPGVSRKCPALGSTALSSSCWGGWHHLLGLAIMGRH